jgi:hypothetical protein
MLTYADCELEKLLCRALQYCSTFGAPRPALPVTRLLLHAYSYTPTLTRLLLHAYSYTPTLTRLLLHAYSYTPTLTLTRLLLHAYSCSSMQSSMNLEHQDRLFLFEAAGTVLSAAAEGPDPNTATWYDPNRASIEPQWSLN